MAIEHYKHQIVCLETEWYFNKKKLLDPFTSQPVLDMLCNLYSGVKYIYRRAATRADLEYLLRELKKSAFSDYDIFYLPFHGDDGCIILEGERGKKKRMTLSELAELADGAFEGKIIHFSSCKTMASEDLIRDFKKTTKARIVSGYTKEVDAMRSTIADLTYLDCIMRHSLPYAKKAMLKNNSDICEELGFVIY